MLRKQLPKPLEQRDEKQLEADEGAEFYRKIDVASVEEAVLSMRLERAAHKPSRKLRHRVSRTASVCGRK
jgi:hypothetical protein